MRLATILLFFSFAAHSQVNRYLANAGTNSGAGTTAAAPWASFSYALANCNPYDTLNLNRGDVFAGDFYHDPSKHHVVVRAYGIGTAPKFSGWQTVPAWVSEGGGRWSYTNSGLPLLPNVVQVDGWYAPMARWPRTGFRTVTSTKKRANIYVVGTDTLADNTLTGAVNFTGALLVRKPVRWVLDVAWIKAHTDSSLVYYPLDGRNFGYEQRVGYGYFLKNHPSFLTQFGDWCYDTAQRKLTMFFGAEIPSNHTVRIGRAPRAGNIGAVGVKYFDIDFEGFDRWGIYGSADSLSFTNCKFSFIGEHAVYAGGRRGYTFVNPTLDRLPNNGLSGMIREEWDGVKTVSFSSPGWRISGLQADSIGAWSGAGGSQDNAYMAVVVSGDSLKLKYSRLTNLGYDGVYFRGGGCEVDSSFYDTFCFIKDDGGAIYTFNGDSSVMTGQSYIRGNIILNGIGVSAGVSPTDFTNEGVTTKARAIYIDEDANHLTITGNTMANSAQDNAGLFAHNAYYLTIQNNLFYKNKKNIHLRTFRLTPAFQTHDVDVSNNTFVSQPGRYQVLVDHAYTSLPFGSINGNRYYSQDTTGTHWQTKTQNYFLTNRTFASWKSAIGGDATSTNNFYTTEQLAYNATTSPVVKPLTGSWKDESGTLYTGAITLPPYTARLLTFYVPPAGSTGGSIRLMMRNVNGKVKVLVSQSGNVLFKEN